MKIFIYLTMIFCHILDDYFLQGMCLGNLKQKDYWEKNAPDRMYRYDYIVALLMHSFSWAFMIMLPVAIYINFQIDILFVVVLILNCIIHFFVDDLKANQKKINLITDQLIHFVQIIATAIIFLFG